MRTSVIVQIAAHFLYLSVLSSFANKFVWLYKVAGDIKVLHLVKVPYASSTAALHLMVRCLCYTAAVVIRAVPIELCND